MCQDVPYLRLPPREVDSTIGLPAQGENFGIPPLGTGVPPDNFTFDFDPSCNGQISIYVLNRLAVPNNEPGVNNDVQINLFVSGCDDFDFQQPTDAFLQHMSFTNPFGGPFAFSEDAEEHGTLPPRNARVAATMESASMGATESENIPTDPPEKTTIAEVNKPEPNLNSIFFGEKFVSFRSLMKRYMLTNNYVRPQANGLDGELINVGGDLHKCNFILPNFPPFPGFRPTIQNWQFYTANQNFLPPAQYITDFDSVQEGVGGLDSATRLRFNTGTLTYFHYVTKMFIGFRGSIRNKYVMNGPNRQSNFGGTDVLRVRRLSASGKTFGMDPPIGTADGAIYPASGDRWNQGLSYVVMSSGDDGPGSPNVTSGTFAMSINGGQLMGGQYAPNWRNNESIPSQSSQVASNAVFGGAHVTTARQMPAIEVELPFYEPTRFQFVDDYFTNEAAQGAHEVTSIMHKSPTDSEGAPVSNHFARQYLSRWVCPGEDFQCFYLVNAPIYFFNDQMIFTNGDGDEVNMASVRLRGFNNFNASTILNGAYPYTRVITTAAQFPTPGVFPP
jgi:hypothetical protein